MGTTDIHHGAFYSAMIIIHLKKTISYSSCRKNAPDDSAPIHQLHDLPKKKLKSFLQIENVSSSHSMSKKKTPDVPPIKAPVVHTRSNIK